MNRTPSFEPIVMYLAPLLTGFGVGLLYFAALGETVKRLSARDGWLEPVALTLGRLGITIAVLAAAARTGAAALLVTFVGFLLARTLALHHARRAG
jgi:F1F0 ATPase subunit 2